MPHDRDHRDKPGGDNSVGAIVARLSALHPKRIDLSLERVERLLAALGHPERNLPPVIHVAGTNGKGSTIAFMRAILEAAGKRVHVYTSPHLVRYNERFRLAGRLATDAELAQVLEECERANGDAPITAFEITTAAGFLLFARHPGDVLLLEVGLGGRLDATNVVERPLASVITPISIDHVDFLGPTLDKIAVEKAGIIKRGVPVFIGAQPREALETLERQAEKMRAPLKLAGQDWTSTEERGRLVYQDESGLLDLPAPKLPGRHQFENAGIAIAVLRHLSGLAVPAAAYETGLSRADWPARMQRIGTGKLLDLLPPGSELWIDGGHNPDGGRAVAAALADLEERVSRPLVMVSGMLATKDSTGFLRNFVGLARELIAVNVAGADKPLPADQLADEARAIGLPATTSNSVEQALANVGARGLSIPPRVLIGGSLYLAGEALRLNGTPPL